MTTLGTITGSVSISLSSAQAIEVGTFDLPVVVDAVPGDPDVVTYQVGSGPLGRAMATALRDLADHIDPDVETVDLPAELAPGWVVLTCTDCDATMVGRPGESLEHADGGAHVHHTTYAAGGDA